MAYSLRQNREIADKYFTQIRHFSQSIIWRGKLIGLLAHPCCAFWINAITAFHSTGP